MVKGFRDFIVKANVISLAVAVAVGSAFGKVVEALINKALMPFVAGLVGKNNFDDVLSFAINGSEISIGSVITAIINFLLIAAAMYFIIVLPTQKFITKPNRSEKSEEIRLLQDIRDILAEKQHND